MADLAATAEGTERAGELGGSGADVVEAVIGETEEPDNEDKTKDERLVNDLGEGITDAVVNAVGEDATSEEGRNGEDSGVAIADESQNTKDDAPVQSEQVIDDGEADKEADSEQNIVEVVDKIDAKEVDAVAVERSESEEGHGGNVATTEAGEDSPKKTTDNDDLGQQEESQTLIQEAVDEPNAADDPTENEDPQAENPGEAELTDAINNESEESIAQSNVADDSTAATEESAVESHGDNEDGPTQTNANDEIRDEATPEGAHQPNSEKQQKIQPLLNIGSVCKFSLLLNV